MTKQPSENLKEQKATHSFKLVVRDREHFYKIVNWLNVNIGRGKHRWTMEGKVLKAIKSGKTINPKVYIFDEKFDIESAVFLSLL